MSRTSKIEQTIDEMEEYIERCKAIPLSNTKIAVSKERMLDFISELRLKVPDEIKKYQRLCSNRDAILASANAEAKEMIERAQVHTKELINEHEIMQRAIEQANEVIADASEKAQALVDKAAQDSNNIRMNAILYTDDMLANLQMIIEHSIEDNKSKHDALMNGLNKDLNIVISNRKELHPEPEEIAAEEELAANIKEVMLDEDDDEGTNDE